MVTYTHAYLPISIILPFHLMNPCLFGEVQENASLHDRNCTNLGLKRFETR